MTKGFAILMVALAGCRTPSVNGTTLRPEVPCNYWTAVVTNSTTRVYDLYIGTRVIATADPGTTTRTVIDPQFGRVIPSLRESPTTRDQKGARLSQGAMRMVCE